ncbi:hypothetical protein OH787_05410 [Streptomyces sp. NBC_01547]|uniref:hypothetical protein n=1 Tax=Streptomyces sp. NBC_01547 TaxID=2975873 RepID=UPI00386F2D49
MTRLNSLACAARIIAPTLRTLVLAGSGPVREPPMSRLQALEKQWRLHLTAAPNAVSVAPMDPLPAVPTGAIREPR